MVGPMMNKIETAILYGEYKALCADRGVFPKAHKELSHFEEAEWLTYVIVLIKELPSQEERAVGIDGLDNHGLKL